MRTSSIAMILALAACDQSTAHEQVAAQPEGERVACAYSGSPAANGCILECERVRGGVLLVLRHPDGGFRRLLQTDDNHLVAADGAEEATVRQHGRARDVTIGRERYILPIDERVEGRSS